MELKITHLALSGGGIKGASLVGALSNLQDKNLLNTIEEYIGSSVGGLICFLLNIGYTCDELKDILLNIDFSQYRNIQFSSIIDKWGFDSGDKLMRLLIAMIKHKNIEPDITFKELYKKTNKKLILTGSELVGNELIYYNYETYPEMRVIDGVRKTISYPIVFYPSKDDNKIVVDGAMFSPYPIDYFKDVKTKIGIVIYNKHNVNEINTCEDYLMTLFKCMEQRYEEIFLKEYIDESIIIDVKDFHGMDFDVSKENKYKMFKIGYDMAEEYLKKHNNNNE